MISIPITIRLGKKIISNNVKRDPRNELLQDEKSSEHEEKLSMHKYNLEIKSFSTITSMAKKIEILCFSFWGTNASFQIETPESDFFKLYYYN